MALSGSQLPQGRMLFFESQLFLGAQTSFQLAPAFPGYGPILNSISIHGVGGSAALSAILIESFDGSSAGRVWGHLSSLVSPELSVELSYVEFPGIQDGNLRISTPVASLLSVEVSGYYADLRRLRWI